MASMSGPAGAEMAWEVEQAWAELLSAARQAGYAVSELVRPPATPEQVAAAEEAIGHRLPPDLAILYQLSDGQAGWPDLVTGPGSIPGRQQGRWVGPLFGAGWTFSTLQELRADYRGWADLRAYYSPAELAADFDDVVEVRGDDPVKPLYTCAGWIPFATDGGGNSLAADLAPAPGGTPGQVIVIGPDEDLRRVLAPSVRALLRLCACRIRSPRTAPRAEDGVARYALEAGPAPLKYG